MRGIYTYRNFPIFDVKKLRFLPFSVVRGKAITENPEVVAVGLNGILYSVGVENNKVVYVLNTSDRKVASFMLRDAYEVAKEIGDKTTMREIEATIKAFASIQKGCPVSVLNIENIRFTVEKLEVPEENLKRAREILMAIRRVILSARKNKKLIEASSFQKGFKEALEFLSRVKTVGEKTFIVDGYVIETDDDCNVKRYKKEDGGEWTMVNESVHITEFVRRIEDNSGDETVELTLNL